MLYRPKRSSLLALPPTMLLVALGGCATGTHDGAPITGRQITQNAPAPDYTVFYWNALRACLQTGRSEWECKSGEQQFMRDALAVEAEMNAQRQQRRQALAARAEMDDDAAPAEPDKPTVATRLSQSVMFERQPESKTPPAPMDIPPGLDLADTRRPCSGGP